MSKKSVGILRYFLKEIEYDCYLIDKGLRRASYEYIENNPTYINEVKNLVVKSYDFFIEPDIISNENNNGNYYFYIYKDLSTKLFINIINGTQDEVIREYLMGILLGYSDDSIHYHFNQCCARIVSKFEKDFPGLDVNTVKDTYLNSLTYVVYNATEKG